MSEGKFIFMSYCHRDEVSLDIMKALRKKGYTVLCDERFSKGEEWDHAAFNAMDLAELCLLVITENYEHSESCMAELKHMIAAGMMDKAFPVFITPEPDPETGKKYEYVVKKLLGKSMWLDYDPKLDGRLKLMKGLRSNEKARKCFSARYPDAEVLSMLKSKRNEELKRLEEEKGRKLHKNIIFSDEELETIAVCRPMSKNDLARCGDFKDGKIMNSDPILELIRELAKPKNSGEAWSEQEKEQLRFEFKYSGLEVSDIAQIHGRSEWAIVCRLSEMGLMDEEEKKTFEKNLPKNLKISNPPGNRPGRVDKITK